mmetsp:Transcript_2440/g.5452  ORF Transcript_2440/g.5452 Transcript_2440/m.5452 type:complete len:85 (+) Transcript_2440:115-369(+)
MGWGAWVWMELRLKDARWCDKRQRSRCLKKRTPTRPMTRNATTKPNKAAMLIHLEYSPSPNVARIWFPLVVGQYAQVPGAGPSI